MVIQAGYLVFERKEAAKTEALIKCRLYLSNVDYVPYAFICSSR